MPTFYNNGETLLVGTAGNDWFINADTSGGQTMVGGAGDDRYEVNSTADLVIENAGGGIDTVWLGEDFWGDYTLAANVNNLTVYGEDDFNFVGNADANVIDLSNTWGEDGEDGGVLRGLGGNDTLIGGYSDDWLIGGAGSDVMRGGWGEDRYYVTDAGDQVIEVTDNLTTPTINEEQGEDWVYTDISYVAPAGIENVMLWGNGEDQGPGSTAALNATGNALDNVLVGNSGNNSLSGLAGEDFLYGGSGNDNLSGGDGEDFLYGDSGNDILDGGAGNDYLSGEDGNDSLTGGDGNDYLTGEDGNDVLAGGAGEDFLYGGNGNDRLDGGDGNDYLSDTYGEDSGNDTLIGGLGNDYIDSTFGADRLEGGAGDDQLQEWGDEFNADGETNVLLGGDGNDIIGVWDNWGANTLDGGAGNDVLLVANYAYEGEDSDFSRYVLNGGAGDDSYFILGAASAARATVIDSAGNDSIYLENDTDTRPVLGNDFDDWGVGYVDADQMMHTYTLAAGIENLFADGLNDGTIGNGENAMYLVGNTADNRILGTDDRDVLLGGAGNDTLEGGASADDMVGGAGNDLYIVGDYWDSSANDTVVEAANEGVADTVWAYESYKLESNVENLRLFGWNDLKGVGNELDNNLTGNNGANYLSGGIGKDVIDGGAGNDRLYGGSGDDNLIGGTGSDWMNGGTGNDTYFVDSYGDTVFEFDTDTGAGGGTDLVQSHASFVLGANIENLRLLGTLDIDGTGNDLANTIEGNSGSNTLSDGSMGWTVPYDESTITGGGNDTLFGGAGNDSYYVNWGTTTANIDVINDSGGTDDWVGLKVGLPGALTLGAGNLANIEHLTIYGSYAGPNGFNITGLAANNEISGSNLGDTIDGGAGNDALTGQSGADVLRGGIGDDSLYGGGWWGDDLAADTLDGGVGNDWLDSTDGGSDRLIGGDGNDTYFIGDSALAGNTFVESSLAAGGSNDVIEAYGQDINLTGSNIEGAVVKGYGENASITATGTGAANFFKVLDIDANGGGSAALLDDVSLIGGAGDDVYVVERGAYNSNQNLGWDGSDQHIFIIENTAGGTDTLRTYADVNNYDEGIVLPDNVENMVLLASYDNGDFQYGAVNGIGNALANTITGNSGDELFPGATAWNGNDLHGGGGNDLLIGDKGNDYLDGDYEDNVTLVGNDIMRGGKGNDEYVVNATGDQVTEAANEGTDKIWVDNRSAALNVTLSAFVENGALWGTSPTVTGGIVGNSLDNDLSAGSMIGSATLSGLDGNDTLHGASGNDILTGGNGNDFLYGGSFNDRLDGGAGNDYLYGDDGDDTLDGGAGDDYLWGGLGNDTMRGGDGNDVYVIDSAGDAVTDSTASTGGTADWVNSSNLNSYTLPNFVENLWLGNVAGNVTAVGNGVANVIEISTSSLTQNTLSGLGGNDTLYGSSGSDYLDGGAGNDLMYGGDANDIYVVDSSADFAMETGLDSGSSDEVRASTSFNLATNGWGIERLVFTASDLLGGTAVVGTGIGIGNELGNFINAAGVTTDKVYLQGGGGNDVLWGGSLADTLDGGAGNDSLVGHAGADTMTGGLGDDYYHVDNSGDIVNEGPEDGYDRITSSVTNSFNQSGVELLKLEEGTTAVSGTGLDFQDDTLIGNSGDNTLSGLDGDDWLNGGNGNDVLFGGDGDDTFAFDEVLDGVVDIVTDFTNSEDVIALDRNTFTAFSGYSSGEDLSGFGDFTVTDGESWTEGAHIGYDPDTGAIYYDPDGVAAGIDRVQIGVLQGAPSGIDGADFIVI